MQKINRKFFFLFFLLSFLVGSFVLFFPFDVLAENSKIFPENTKISVIGDKKKVSTLVSEPIQYEVLKGEVFVNELNFPSNTEITDTFYYDTTKEEDSSWRTDSSKSWYTEKKDDAEDGICDWQTGDGDGDPHNGSDDRCGSSEFPEKALIVSTKDNVYIFDAETRGMWMRFDEGVAVGNNITSPVNTIFALNGEIYLAMNGTGGGGISITSFKKDESTRIATAGKYLTRAIIDRDLGFGSAQDRNLKIISAFINDIHARVINGKTYVAVATDGGVSVINETDGTVQHLNRNYSFRVKFNNDKLYVSQGRLVNNGNSISNPYIKVFDKNFTEIKTINGNNIFLKKGSPITGWHNKGSQDAFLHLDFFGEKLLTQNKKDNEGWIRGLGIINTDFIQYITKSYATLPIIGEKTKGHWVDSLEDRSGKGNTLTNVGNVQISPVANGAELTAFEFDGTNYLESDSDDFNITGNLTVGAWVKTTNNEVRQSITTWSENKYNGWLHIRENKTLAYSVYAGEGSTEVYCSGPTGALPKDEWVFVNALRNTETHKIKLFINGNLIKTCNDTNLGAVDLNGNFLLGKSIQGFSNFQGKIALPFVSSEAYTDEQIKNLYDQTKEWFKEDAKITLQGNSDNVKDIACSPLDSARGPLCFIATDDGVITELNTETGITKKSEKIGTKITLDSTGKILGTAGKISGKFVFAEEKNIITKTLENLPENSDFTITLPSGIILKNAENGNHLKTDSNGKLTFELQAEKIFVDSEKNISFFLTENPEISGRFNVKIWGIQGDSQILSGKSYEKDFFSGDKVIDKTPEFYIEISGRNDDVSKNIKSVFQISKSSDFSSENIILEKTGESFVTLPETKEIIDLINELNFPSNTEITDTFYYDTTKEEDSSWRTDSSKSWYTEKKDDAEDGICDWQTGDGDGDPHNGSDDRCGSSEFPEKALIVSTKDNVYIFDAETRGMWMRFDEGGGHINGSNTGSTMIWNPPMNISSIFALNGSLYVGKNNDPTHVDFAFNIDFKNDNATCYAKAYKRDWATNISERNTLKGYPNSVSGQWLINNAVNDIHARVINGKTYVAVATDGGVSVINETDGKVVSRSNIYNDTLNKVSKVYISDSGELYVKGGVSVNQGATYIFSPLNTLENKKSYWGAYGYNTGTWLGNIISNYNQFFPLKNNFIAIADKANDGRNGGFYLLNPVEKYFKSVTKSFATLPLYGETKGHWVDSLEDRSGKGNTLTNVGNVQISPVANGAELTAFEFDGTNYLESDSSDFNITGNLTVGAWVKKSLVSHSTFFQIHKNNGSWVSSPFWFFTSGGKPAVVIKGKDLRYGDFKETFDNSPVLNNEKWQFVSVSYDKNKVSIFIDGEKVQEHIVGDILKDYEFDKLRIGKTLQNRYSAKFIALPFVSSEAYTDEQIKNLYDQTKNWFDEDAKITLQGDSDVVKDIACSSLDSARGPLCFVATDDGVITELNTETGITKLSEKTGTKITLDSTGKILGTAGKISGKFVFAEEKTLERTIRNAGDKISQIVSLSDEEKLEENIEYFARVRSVDEAGRVSRWSRVFKFKKEQDVVPYVPSNIKMFIGGTDNLIKNGTSVVAGSVDVSFDISDKNSDQKLKYQLQLGADDKFREVLQDITPSDFLMAGTQKSSLQFLVPAQKYFLRIRAIDEGGNVSNWSNTLSFSTEIQKAQNLFIKAKEDLSDPDSYKNFTGENISFSDKSPIFGFTIPSEQSLPIFLSRSIKGKGIAYINEVDYKEENNEGSFEQRQKKFPFSGNTGKISETSLSGFFKLGDKGYIYLDQNSMPSYYHQFLPADFISVKNDTKGHFSQRAWSNIFGWLDFSSSKFSQNPPKKCETSLYFDEESYFSCVDDAGKFQGYAKIEHPIFITNGLKEYFGNDWENAKQYFLNGEDYTKKIFKPLLTSEKISSLEEGTIKTKLQNLWNKEGGYIRFSDPLIAVPEKMHTKWRRDGVQKLIDVKSGIQNGDTPEILINGLNAFDDSFDLKSNYSIVHLTGDRWEIFDRKTFDISADATNAEKLKQFLDAIPTGDIIILTTGKNPSLHLEIFLKEIKEFGSTSSIIENITENDSYILVGRKGKKFPLFEKFSDEKNTSYSQNSLGLAPIMRKDIKNALFQGTGELGFIQTQNLGHLIFIDNNQDIYSEITGTKDLENATPQNSGIIGTAFSTAAGIISFDADGEFGATNSTPDDYGVVIDYVDPDGNIFFSGRAWGDGIGFIEMSRGERAEKCETVESPGNNFGVCRDKDGAFHGYAWSPSFGWISFENVFSHDPLSSVGYTFELVDSKGKTYIYSISNIPSGEILLPTEEIQKSLHKNCSKDPNSCLLPYEKYKWRVKTRTGDVESPFTHYQYFTLSSLEPVINHQCLEKIPLKTRFTFEAMDRNVPTSKLKYTINFIDISDTPYYINPLVQLDYTTPENNTFVTEEKDFSDYNGRKISYEIILENEEGKKVSKICNGEGGKGVPIRGLEAKLISPPFENGNLVDANTDFVFQVKTIHDDSYTYTIEVQENTQNISSENFVWDENAPTISKTGTKNNADEQNIHSVKVPGMEVDKNYCWRVSVESFDKTSDISEIKCFSTQNGNPEIKDLTVWGNNTPIYPLSSIGQTSDTTPSFEFIVQDDSKEVTATVIIISEEDATKTQTIIQTLSLNENDEAHFVMTLPNDKALENFGIYNFSVQIEDDGGEKSEKQEGRFILNPSASGAIGYGNIGTPHIHFDPVSERENHRFAFDVKNNIGVIDMNPVAGGVHITANKVYGYAWNTHTGWIRFNCGANPDTIEGYPTNSITEINDIADPYCGSDLEKYGVKPGVLNGLSKQFGVLRGVGVNQSQDLLGKAKFEIMDENQDLKTEFLYFDIASYKEDFPNNNLVVDNWKNNDNGAKAVGVDSTGKLSGYAWSPSFGWIAMGKDYVNAEKNWQSNYPITEYIPSIANCKPEQLFEKSTYIANSSLQIPIIKACSGKKLHSCNFHIKDSNGQEHSFSSACDNVDNIIFDVPYPEIADVTYSIWGSAQETSGQTISIAEENAMKVKIIADPKPDFSKSRFEIRNNSAFANGKDTISFDVELKDKYGNRIYNDLDINNNPAKRVKIGFNFKDLIRLDQLSLSPRGKATSISGTNIPALFPPLGKNKKIPLFFVQDEVIHYDISSYAPTNDIGDSFSLDSIILSIADIRDGRNEEIFTEEKFSQNQDHVLTLSYPVGSTTNNVSIPSNFVFSKIFSGKTYFENTIFDENSLEENIYKIFLTQDFHQRENQLEKTSLFHFMNCLDSLPQSGLLEFSPLEYGEGGNIGKNCYEISSNGNISKLSSKKNGRTDDDNAVDYVGKEIPFTETGNDPVGNLYDFKTKAFRSGDDIPEEIVPALYIAFKVNINGSDQWIKYEIPNENPQTLSFIIKSGYIEGTTHGEFIYESEVSNKEEGVFSQVGSIEKIEVLRNTLMRSLSEYIAEDGGRKDSDFIANDITIPSAVISDWLKGIENSSVAFKNIDPRIKVLDDGNMIWIRADKNSDDFTLTFGDRNPIDDETFGSSKTLVLEGGNIEINADIFRRGEGVLAIIVLRHPDQLYDENSWDNAGNILIDQDVKNIRAMMYADGSILSYGSKTVGAEKTVYDGFDSEEIRKENLYNQLYILGSVSSLNTYGGAASPDRKMKINGEDVYVNTLSHKPVWANSHFDKTNTDIEHLRSESIRFDLKRLREFSPHLEYLDDKDDYVGVRDDLDEDITGDGVIDENDLSACQGAGLSDAQKEACAPQQGTYQSENSSNASFFDPNATWDDQDSLTKAQTSVIFEYDEQIQKNPAPGTIIYESLILK